MIFRRIMHRGQKLKLRLRTSMEKRVFLVGHPSETVDWFREVYG